MLKSMRVTIVTIQFKIDSYLYIFFLVKINYLVLRAGA